MGVAGDSEAGLRALSVVASLVALFAAWRWAHEALGRWPGLAVLVVVGLSPVALSNARVARMYSLEAAFATVAWWMTWRLVTGRARDARSLALHSAVLAIAGAGEVWTMALGPPTLLLQSLVAGAAVVSSRRAARHRAAESRDESRGESRSQPAAASSGARWATGALVVAGLSFLPWLPNLLPIATSGRAYWTPPPEPLSWALTWRTMLVGYRDDVSLAIPLGVLLLLVGAVGLVWLLTRADRDARWLGWCAGAGLGLTVLVWAVSLVRSVYDTRYLEASLPPLAVAVAAGASALVAWSAAALTRLVRSQHPRVPRMWVAAASIVAGAVLLRAMVPSTLTWLDDWRNNAGPAPTRELVAAVAPRLRSGDVLLARDARSYFTLAYEAEMLRRRGAALAAPVRNWDSGREPFYNGQSLIPPEETISASQVAARGWSGAFPELASDGSVWLIALANGRNERLGFAPLDTGAVREVDRIVVELRNDVGQARQLMVVR